MPTPRVLMSKIRQALQLSADSGLSGRQVVGALGIRKTIVSELALYARGICVMARPVRPCLRPLSPRTCS
jgi:hypothetical protein